MARREAYLKRCVGLAGDTLAMKNELLYINGRPQHLPPGAETYFHVVTKGQQLDEAKMKADYGIDISNGDDVRPLNNTTDFEMLLTWEAREKMLGNGFARQVSPDIDSSSEGIFPNDEGHPWTRDNFGPLWIPQKGTEIDLTPANYPIYERIIRTYEGNTLERRQGKIFINGQEATRYTFKMNYYWMMGDNLHGSQDSRYWGFVPEDHLIGKVMTIL